LIFSILTRLPKSAHHSGFQFVFLSPFRVSSSRERALPFQSEHRWGKSQWVNFRMPKPENQVIAHKKPTKK